MYNEVSDLCLRNVFIISYINIFWKRHLMRQGVIVYCDNFWHQWSSYKWDFPRIIFTLLKTSFGFDMKCSPLLIFEAVKHEWNVLKRIVQFLKMIKLKITILYACALEVMGLFGEVWDLNYTILCRLFRRSDIILCIYLSQNYTIFCVIKETILFYVCSKEEI